MVLRTIERALFVVGQQKAGKSVQLRSMFRDPRFGTDGKIPSARKVREIIQLSTDLQLYLRLTSPHESNEAVEDWLEKVNRKTLAGQWCVVGPLQPLPHKRMPDAAEAVDAFVQRFAPKRVRIVFLSPDRCGKFASESFDVLNLTTRLWSIPSVEIMSIDARDREANGLLLTDFFDYDEPPPRPRA